MGRPKLGMDLAGRSIIERSLDTLLLTPVDEVVIVLPPGMAAPGSLAPVRTVVNERPEEGLASSIRVGLSKTPGEARGVLIALADKPLVRAETVRAVLERFNAGGAAIVYPTYRGQQGHPVAVAAALFEELRALEGDQGAKPLLKKHARDAVAVPLDDPGILLDIDTPEDYAEALARFERPS